MKDIFTESVNRYNGLDDTRKEAIISLYHTLFEADEAKEKKEEQKTEKKEEPKAEKKEEKKEDAKEADGDAAEEMPFKVIRNRTPSQYMGTRKKLGDVQYIALHYTAGSSSAKGQATRTKFRPNTSADFIVDDGEIYQFNPDLDRYYSFAVGAEKPKYQKYVAEAEKRGTHGAGALYNSANNRNTISIEMCSNYKGKMPEDVKPYDTNYYLTEATLANTAKVVAYLHKKYPNAQIVRHFDISGKPCPGPWCRDDKGTATFKAFVSRCLGTPVPDEPEYDNVDDTMMPKDKEPPWPDFGRFFDPDNTSTTTPTEEDVLDISNGDVVNTIKKAVGNSIGKTLIDVITKNSGKVSPYVVKDFVTMITQPKNKEMLKNVLKLASNQ